MAINPFAQPINYSAQFVDLTPAFRAAGEGFRAIGEGIQERAKQEETMTLKAQYATDLQNALNNPTQATWSQMIAKYPQQREAFAEARKGFGETALANEFNQGFEVSTALENKRPEVAKERLQTFITARKNSNLPTGIYEDALEALERNDVLGAQANVNSALAMADPDRFQKQVEARLKASTAPSALKKSVADADAAVAAATTAQAAATNAAEKATADAAKATADAAKAKVEADVALATKPSVISEAASKADEASVKAAFAERLQQAGLNLNAAQIRNINNEISNRAAKLNLDTQTMQATVAEKLSSIQKNLTELPADTRKLVNDSAVTAAAAKQSAGQFNDLARQIEAAGGGYGVFSSASEFLKKGTGFQGGLTQLRNEYTRLRNSAAIKSLPPGPATDADIQLALKPFPPETADARTMASFLRGMAKLQDIDASVANAKTDWLSNNNGVLTRARNTFQAGDYATKPGESFNDFTQRVVQDVSKRYNPAAQTPLVSQIPTDRNPRPAAAANDIKAQADAILRGGQ